MKPHLFLLFVLSGCASAPRPMDAKQAENTRAPVEVVQEHLRSVEAGDWERAQAQLSPEFRMQMKGMPFFVSIDYDDALSMHRARKRAFPDFRFNEKVVERSGNSVTVAVYLTGTHTGYLDYPIDEVPKAKATGKTIDLPAEYFTYYVRNDRITEIFGRIPKGHGPDALIEQLELQRE